MDRQATAHWTGDILTGKGQLSTESKVLNNTAYSFSTRFESSSGTNPEELIAAAHAGCFTMALAGALKKNGHVAESLDTQCIVSVEKAGEGFKITTSKLELKARVPGLEHSHLVKMAEEVKKSCPASQALKVEMDLKVHEL